MAIYLSRYLWLSSFGAFLIVADLLQPADAILPLAGQPFRPVAAAELFNAGYAEHFLVTHLPLATAAERDQHLRQVVRRVTEQGVPEDAIYVVPGVAHTTYQEALNVRAVVERQGWRSLIVVTSPAHTRRSRIIFRDVFRNTGIDVSVQPVVQHGYRADTWWLSAAGRQTTWSEYLKLMAHYLGVR